jgi:hypothetical protein
MREEFSAHVLDLCKTSIVNNFGIHGIVAVIPVLKFYSDWDIDVLKSRYP